MPLSGRLYDRCLPPSHSCKPLKEADYVDCGLEAVTEITLVPRAPLKLSAVRIMFQVGRNVGIVNIEVRGVYSGSVIGSSAVKGLNLAPLLVSNDRFVKVDAIFVSVVGAGW